MLRWVVRCFLLLWLVYLVVFGVWYLQEPVYVSRFLSYPYRRPIMTVRWYAPLARVKGRLRRKKAENVASSVGSGARQGGTGARKKRGWFLEAGARTQKVFFGSLASRQRSEGKAKEAMRGGIPMEALQRAEAYAERTRASALLIMRHGELIMERYWRGHHRTALSNSMSMAKTILALLVGVALEEGKLRSLDEQIAAYLPMWKHDQRGSIRIKHLLEMTSGLRGDGRMRDPWSDVVRLYHTPDILATLERIPKIHAAGSVFEYKDVDSQVLGLVLERATGIPYAQYLSEKIWQPLGGSDAFVWLDREGGAAKTSCCLFATARDWARVGQLILDRGRRGEQQIIPKAWIEAMLKPSFREPSYGYQIWRSVSPNDPPYPAGFSAPPSPFLAEDMVYLEGIFGQFVYILPSQGLVIVRLGEGTWRWQDETLPNLLFSALQGI
jgi:CubicO group peptidase (beta-lactamase class C family)